MANRYSDIAIANGTELAGKAFYDDYFDGKMTCNEHVAVMCLTQQYINCKNGNITRETCLQRQSELFRRLDEDNKKLAAALDNERKENENG